MSLYVSNYVDFSANTVTKQTYIDKFDKSLKLPFVSVMKSNLQNVRVDLNGEQKPNESELKVNDTVELSSAVTGAASAENTGQQGLSK